ncbi:MAG: glycerol-3-phosphate 1-O-acyltransferase PlsY [Chlorobi bacterium]|nr:glycerol-3-phosphate 1-O-acyltransferase PlsY [Chlorobiota bacterium]
MLNLITIIILSYLVGSIPNSIIVSKKVAGINIKSHGSGNAGGTNVMRILGWKYGLLVILLDALKGAIAVVLISRLYLGSFPFPNATPFDDFTLVQIMAGLSAIIGHIWTVFAGFKGGKGIATGVGVYMALVTLDIALAIGVFALVVVISRYVSLGSIIAAISVPLIMIVRENIFGVDISGYHTLLPFSVILTALIVFAHRENIKRLIAGKESKLSFSKNKTK